MTCVTRIMNGRWSLEFKLCLMLKIMTPPERIWPCDLQKLINSLKLKKASEVDFIPNECVRHLHLTHLIIHYSRLSHFPTSWKEARVVSLPKPGKTLNSHKIYARLAFCPRREKFGGRNLLNASHFGFCERHSMTLQCMRLADHVTLNFNNKMHTAAVFMDIEKGFDSTWHRGLLYNLSKL
jgi:hypothetical protein